MRFIFAEPSGTLRPHAPRASLHPAARSRATMSKFFPHGQIAAATGFPPLRRRRAEGAS